MNHPYAAFVTTVEKPARYLGGEYQSVRKDFAAVDVRIALAFPDVYEVGMSHLGTKILYSLLNKDPRILCERAFTPWVDMEAELRRRQLPLLSLESARPLRDFDVVGMSLQYELTYTNCLTLLDLGGVPLRACDRGDHDPLVLGGGPTATHPEPVAPFFDAFLLGEAEEVLPELLLYYGQMKREGVPRRERLIRLAARGAIYVPELYSTARDPRTHRVVVDRPLDPRVPERVQRSFVRDLNRFPFPSDAPVPYAEAIFDRVSVEIARGCTEGCRFCQAGMIYRPVRERDPESIVDSVLKGIKNGGYDETSLTSLSTADYSCILPLMKKVMGRLREEKVSLSVSSLRAYGLNPEILDEMASVRATGLTFAPEAGTQRMRDVINKNITEEDITRSAENIFSRGWSRMKCYFMIGLPTETDEDVAGIAQTGGRLRRLGKKIRPDAEVTVSVSSHVPKPHTPFQWCAQDPPEEIERKQRLLREIARAEGVQLKHHEGAMSWVEGLLCRGDRPLADVIEAAWRRGARFDSWDDRFSLTVWQEALQEAGVDPTPYFMTLPVDGKLPWDHLDVGLEDGFLLGEYRRALKDRASPPCGKPFGSLLHHTNLADALADSRKLVCYDCGVACDLSQMREERLVYLRTLGATERPATPMSNADKAKLSVRRGQQRPQPAFAQGAAARYRIRYTKLGRASFIAHLDTMRLLQRMLRRAGVDLIYTSGFHPKPDMSFGPALGLGVLSLGEVVDLRVEKIDGVPALTAGVSAETLRERLCAAAPEGVRIDAVTLVPDNAPGLSRLIEAAEWAIGLPAPEGAFVDLEATLGAVATWPERSLVVRRKGKTPRDPEREIDARRFLLRAEVVREPAALRALLEWPQDTAVITASVRLAGDGGIRPVELAEVLLGAAPPAGMRYARLGLLGPGGIDLCAAEALRPKLKTAAPSAVEELEAAEAGSAIELG
ncbi:MAG: TIGR03960 family B12-binding radical SAM protein [Polyangia bacterium]